MGCVYRVLDERTGTRLALKRLLRGNSRNHVALFEREYRTLVGIQHPRIIRAFDYGVDSDGPYYTMELAPGRDLHKLAPLPAEAALSYLRDVATCLGLLHTRRLLHRDVTPHNVRILDNGECKLIDFGALTSFGIPELIVGTPPCIPPEALKRAPLDQRADIFSFGAMLYWTLTRRHAYPAREISELSSMWQKRPAPPSVYASGISEPLDAFVLRLLHINPQMRPATMAEVVERLTVLGQLPPETEATQHALAESYLVHTSCVGREPELRRLREVTAQLAAGKGSSFLMLGQHGVGRSRLLHEVSLQGQLLGLPTLQLDASARPEPHGSAIALLEHLIDNVPAAKTFALAHAPALAQLDSGLAERLGVAAAAPHAEISGDWRARTQQLVLELVSTACLSKPLLLLIDDIDEADDASLAVFAGLSGLVAQTQLALVGAATAQGAQERSTLSWRSLRKRSETIDVAPLSARDVTTLARSLFGDVPNLQRFAEWLNEHAGGLPLHCMALIRRLHGSGEIRYLDGLWVLPVERPSQVVSHDLNELLAARVESLSSSARSLAEALAAQRGALTRERCATLVQDANPLVLLDELVRAEVLDDSLQGYRFTHTALRDIVARQTSPERKQQLHQSFAAHALESATEATLIHARMDAGWHLLQAGQDERGADLLAAVAYDAVGVRLAFADLQVMVPALEAALSVYTKLGRPLHERMPLLATLAQAGYYEDRTWGVRYGDAALAAVLELSGLNIAQRLRPYLGSLLSLGAGLATGWIRFKLLPRRVHNYKFIDVLTQLFASVTTLTGAAAISLDVPRASRLAATLELFLGLPRRVTAKGIGEFCRSLQDIGRDKPAESVHAWSTLLSHFQNPRYFIALPKSTRPLYVGGLLFAQGVFESFRDGKGALEAADALDRLGLKLYCMVASAVRAIHFANRGDLIQARLHREQVDVYAIQVGSAWQVELWEPAALILVYAQTGDVTEMLRISDRLAVLAQTSPSLRLHAQLARLALNLVREDDGGLAHDVEGSKASFVALQEEVLAVLKREPPRSFIGWGAVCGFSARALNFGERHEEAKRLCEYSLSQLTEADRPFVTLYLNIELELAAAEAGLGAVAPARARLDDILHYHAHSDNPLTRGRIHEAYVRLAARSGDWPTFREHLEAMRNWYAQTSSASLIARVERLRVLDPVQSNRPNPGTAPEAVSPVRPANDASPAANSGAANAEAEVTICTVTEVSHEAREAPELPDARRTKP